MSEEKNGYKAMTSTEIRAGFGEIVNEVRYTRDPIVIQKRGKSIAALIAYEDFEILQGVIAATEDELDAEAIEESRDETLEGLQVEGPIHERREAGA